MFLDWLPKKQMNVLTCPSYPLKPLVPFARVIANCPICIMAVIDPVCVDCGHVICKTCVGMLKKNFYLQIECPCCRQMGNFRKIYLN